MADDGIFSELCRYSETVWQLEQDVEKACVEIFGMIFVATDYNPEDMTLIIYDVPRQFRARPEQLEKVWRLGATRLRTVSRQDPQRLGPPEEWYYYDGGPTEGTCLTGPRR